MVPVEHTGGRLLVSVEANKAVVRRFVGEVLAQGNFAALNALAAPDCLDHAAPPGHPSGLVAISHLVVLWHAAFPDLQITIEDLLGEGEKVAVRATLRGTHRGDFFGVLPTGRQVTVTALELYCLAGGKIVERWAVVDTLGLLHQLGAPFPPPPAAPSESRWLTLA